MRPRDPPRRWATIGTRNDAPRGNRMYDTRGPGLRHVHGRPRWCRGRRCRPPGAVHLRADDEADVGVAEETEHPLQVVGHQAPVAQLDRRLPGLRHHLQRLLAGHEGGEEGDPGAGLRHHGRSPRRRLMGGDSSPPVRNRSLPTAAQRRLGGTKSSTAQSVIARRETPCLPVKPVHCGAGGARGARARRWGRGGHGCCRSGPLWPPPPAPSRRTGRRPGSRGAGGR